MKFGSIVFWVCVFAFPNQALANSDIRADTPDTDQACIILLHGLARSSISMRPIERHLKGKGYHTVNLSYDSRAVGIESLAPQIIESSLIQCEQRAPIHFVTHSLGGILLRQYMSENDIPDMGRSVMLGPPNKGSEIPDKLGKIPGFALINGPAGLQLGTEAQSVPNALGPVNFDLGIIAGRRSINWFLSLLIPEKDDGKVAIENTKVAGMNDHIVLPVSHPMMMNSKAVMFETVYYIENGVFSPDVHATQTRVKNKYNPTL